MSSSRMIQNVADRALRQIEASNPAREMYLPRDVRGTDPIVPEGTDLEIWKYDAGGNIYGIAFAGKANKPLWHYSFKSEQRFQQLVDETVQSRRSQLQRKTEMAQARREWAHPYKEGDILYSSWGYDQTQVDFYQVTAVRGKAIQIREIASRSVSGDKVVAVPGKFIGPPMSKVPQGTGDPLRAKGDPGYVRLNSFSSARLWDGKPKYVTPFGAGH